MQFPRAKDCFPEVLGGGLFAAEPSVVAYGCEVNRLYGVW